MDSYKEYYPIQPYQYQEEPSTANIAIIVGAGILGAGTIGYLLTRGEPTTPQAPEKPQVEAVPEEVTKPEEEKITVPEINVQRIMEILMGIAGAAGTVIAIPVIAIGEAIVRITRGVFSYVRSESVGRMPSIEEIPQDIRDVISRVLNPSVPDTERAPYVERLEQWAVDEGILPKQEEVTEEIPSKEPVVAETRVQPIEEAQPQVITSPRTVEQRSLDTIHESNSIVIQVRNPMENTRLMYLKTQPRVIRNPSGEIVEGQYRVYKIEKLPSDDESWRKAYLWIVRDLYNRLVNETGVGEERYQNYRWQVRGNTLYLCRL